MHYSDRKIIKEAFGYDPETGIIRRLHGRYAGDIKPTYETCGFSFLTHKGKDYLAHRVAWLLHEGVDSTDLILHRNGDKTDNRWCNLYEATSELLSAMQTVKRKNNTSGFTGVNCTKNRKGFMARIVSKGKRKILGTFATAEEASDVYQAAHRKRLAELMQN